MEPDFEIFWHDNNPWADRAVYIPLHEVDQLIPAIELEHYMAQYGPRIDAYLLRSPSGEISFGLRYGSDRGAYLSPPSSAVWRERLWNKYGPKLEPATDPDELLRQKFHDEGWGKIAEECGLDPLNCEGQARRVLRKWAEERARRPQFQKNEMFHTPASFDEINEWVERHPKEMKLHLYTLWMLLNNFYASIEVGGDEE